MIAMVFPYETELEAFLNGLLPGRPASLADMPLREETVGGYRTFAWEGAGFHRFLRRSGATGWELRLITEEACEARPGIEALKERMAGGFPAAYPLLESLP